MYEAFRRGATKPEYASTMPAKPTQSPKGPYRFSALGVVMWGVLFLIVGSVASTNLSSSWGAILSFLSLPGVILIVVGVVRAVSERRIAQSLAERAALVTIASASPDHSNVAAELARLNDLHRSGALTDAEFTTAKSKLLA
jgi:hypothetical protein